MAQGSGHFLIGHVCSVLMVSPQSSQSVGIHYPEYFRFFVLPSDEVFVPAVRKQLIDVIPKQSTVCYSPNGHGVLFRGGDRDHDVVHVSQVFPMREVDGFPFSMQPVLGEPGLFEIHGVPGVQDQRVHDGAGHQLDHACALLPGAGWLRVGLRGRWAVIILHGRH